MDAPLGFGNFGATYEEAVKEMLHYGAVNACLMMGGSSSCMMYRPDRSQAPQLLSPFMIIEDGEQRNLQRRLPTYWMVAAE